MEEDILNELESLKEKYKLRCEEFSKSTKDEDWDYYNFWKGAYNAVDSCIRVVQKEIKKSKKKIKD